MQNLCSGKCLKCSSLNADMIWLTFNPLFETFAQLPGYYMFVPSNNPSWKTSFGLSYLTDRRDPFFLLSFSKREVKERKKNLSSWRWKKSRMIGQQFERQSKHHSPLAICWFLLTSSVKFYTFSKYCLLLITVTISPPFHYLVKY